MKKLSLVVFSAIFGVSAFAASCDSPQMKGIISGLNSNVPQRVDSVTTLTGAECKDGSLRYVYELNDADGVEFSKFDTNQKKMFEDIQKGILQNLYCTSLKELHMYTNSIIWTYNMKDVKFAEFELKSSDCK